MFTGLVLGTGRICLKEQKGEAVRIEVETVGLLDEAEAGDSVAVDGCCLTVVTTELDGAAPARRVAFDAIPETLRRTTLGTRKVGDRVNLELPLRVGDRLGGHFVQGHVDAVAPLVQKREAGDDVVLRFALPEALQGHVVEKGSVALDGVSLTVSAVFADAFEVSLIPHTLLITTLGDRDVGDRVNVEGDVLAKYVAAGLGSSP